MVYWFVTDAPIRQKMLLSFTFMTGLVALASLGATAAAAMGHVAIAVIVSAGCATIAALAGIRIREMICDPYVATVVRMEALAAGDLTSPIAFTEYKDCVGRMTRAMFAFRDTATARERHEREQQLVVGKRCSVGTLLRAA